MAKKYYTGVGSRITPKEILFTMQSLAGQLARTHDWTLRSGGAQGADTAFAQGHFSSTVSFENMEIYLPWKGFNKNPSKLYYVSPEAIEIAEEIYGPSFKYLKRPVKLLMARNMYQVTGLTLDTPSDFVICWTEDGCKSMSERTKRTGGTGQAIAYASSLAIPVFNLQRYDAEERLIEFLEENER